MSLQELLDLPSSTGGVVLVIGVTLIGVTSVYCWLQHRWHVQKDVHFGDITDNPVYGIYTKEGMQHY